jgi:membrane protein required for colicin V production
MNFPVVDIVFGVLVLILVVRCALRGFIEEFMSMAAFVLGLLVAVLLFKPGAEFIRDRWGDKYFPELLSFVVLFAIGFIVVKILERILKDIVERIHLTGLDRGLGVLLGLVEGLLVVALVLFVLNIQPLFDAAPLLESSLFSRYLMPFVSLAGNTAAAQLGT